MPRSRHTKQKAKVKEIPMKSLKKMLLLCLGAVVIMMFFNSCESNEKKEKRHVNESFQSLEECINTKDPTTFQVMFNSIGYASLNDSDIDQLFTMFPSGIVSNPTPYDDYFTVTDWVESNSYGKNICWSREIINNATREHFGISVLECITDQYSEDLGIIRLIVYPIEKEDEFDVWWNEIEEDDRPNGLIIYKAE